MKYFYGLLILIILSLVLYFLYFYALPVFLKDIIDSALEGAIKNT